MSSPLGQVRRLPLVRTDASQEGPSEPASLLLGLLREQEDLSAVERFSRAHDRMHDAAATNQAREDRAAPSQARYYRHLIPVSSPGPGEQYGFEVDLDRCSGCKACVTACHQLNGLDEGETWRFVGLLHGGTPQAPMQKTVTSACHHCVEPACLEGCPVLAYDKNPVTGIVRHLDDQCIGCQYCVFTCPYEVPQFNPAKGIVRKCDMCSERLTQGEAPACVQACPNEAIAIQIVDTKTVIEEAQSDTFLPGVPSPGLTLPSTVYKTTDSLPRNLLPADFYAVRPAHTHRPLVLMLVLTQLSVGAFSALQWSESMLDEALLADVRPMHALIALSLALLALAASTLHLGRPLYAWRAVLGLKTSWLSREIVVFGVFAKLAILYAGALWIARHPDFGATALGTWAERLAPLAGPWVAGTGLLGVGCSIMLYQVTQRKWWTGGRTSFKFLMTSAVLGMATLLVSPFAAALTMGRPLDPRWWPFIAKAGGMLALLTAVKLLGEASVLLHLRDRQHGDLKRSARLLTGELQTLSLVRIVLGGMGGIALPWLFLPALESQSVVFGLVAALIMLAMTAFGEILERVTFFAALSSPRMPGGPR